MTSATTASWGFETVKGPNCPTLSFGLSDLLYFLTAFFFQRLYPLGGYIYFTPSLISLFLRLQLQYTLQEPPELQSYTQHFIHPTLEHQVRSKSLVCIHLGKEQHQVKTGGLLLLVIGST